MDQFMEQSRGQTRERTHYQELRSSIWVLATRAIVLISQQLIVEIIRDSIKPPISLACAIITHALMPSFPLDSYLFSFSFSTDPLDGNFGKLGQGLFSHGNGPRCLVGHGKALQTQGHH